MIEQWIAPAALEEAAAGRAQERFAGDPSRLLVIDNALRPDRYALLSGGLRTDCAWKSEYGIRDVDYKRVEKEEYEAVPAMRQRYLHAAFGHPLPGREMAPGFLGLIRFNAVVRTPQFMDFLGRITGCRPAGLQEMHIRRMGPGDIAKPHSDAAGDRVLCLLLYFTDGWRPEFDGRFVMHTKDAERAFDPLPNRMILFDVNTDQNHSVRSLPNQIGDWRRYSLTIWFQ